VSEISFGHMRPVRPPGGALVWGRGLTPEAQAWLRPWPGSTSVMCVFPVVWLGYYKSSEVAGGCAKCDCESAGTIDRTSCDPIKTRNVSRPTTARSDGCSPRIAASQPVQLTVALAIQSPGSASVFRASPVLEDSVWDWRTLFGIGGLHLVSAIGGLHPVLEDSAVIRVFLATGTGETSAPQKGHVSLVGSNDICETGSRNVTWYYCFRFHRRHYYLLCYLVLLTSVLLAIVLTV